MGWTTTQRPTNVKKFLTDLVTWDNPEKETTNRALDCAIVNLHTAYLAVEKISPEGREVWAAVVLLGFYPKERYYNFGYKAMDEGMGPCERSCPERILKLLTPLPEREEGSSSSWAAEWRRDCWAKIEEAKKWKALKKEGTRLKSKDPAGVKFNGIETPIQEAVLELVQGRRKKVWAVRVLPGYTYYRFNDYIKSQMEVA
jgi:hypothetical protein